MSIITSIPKVAVLMSTYNGEQFLREQLDSILVQTDVEVSLFIRDDGSSDSTCSILTEYQKKYPDIRLYLEKNVGVFGSFMNLLYRCGDRFDFYAFADQDDVWNPRKLMQAVSLLWELSGSPAMYYGRLAFVDESLRPLGNSAVPHNSGFHNALVQNQATGCTIVLNREARTLLTSRKPDWALMHDWWCYLVISAFGQTVYDPEPHILYRKHGKNVTPATPVFALELYARLRRFMGKGDIPQKVTDQLRHFMQLYGDQLTPEKKQLAEGFLKARSEGVFGRLRYALSMPLKRNTPFDNLIMRLLVVIGRF